jgi:hypothetical protein
MTWRAIVISSRPYLGAVHGVGVAGVLGVGADEGLHTLAAQVEIQSRI